MDEPRDLELPVERDLALQDRRRLQPVVEDAHGLAVELECTARELGDQVVDRASGGERHRGASVGRRLVATAADVAGHDVQHPRGALGEAAAALQRDALLA